MSASTDPERVRANGHGLDVGGVLSGVRDSMTVQRVFGEPIDRDGVTVVPVAVIRGGGGGGGGERPGDSGSGLGYGIRAQPVGVYEIRDGAVRWRPAVDVNRAVAFAGVTLMVLGITLRSLRRPRGRR